jgi:hypothetical protein
VGIPYALFPAIFTGFLLNLTLYEILMMCIFVYSIVLGGIFVGVGITASNPSFEDTSSGAFIINQIGTILILMILIIVSLIQGVLFAITQVVFVGSMLLSSIPTPIVGLVILMFGMIRLNFSEVD